MEPKVPYFFPYHPHHSNLYYIAYENYMYALDLHTHQWILEETASKVCGEIYCQKDKKFMVTATVYEVDVITNKVTMRYCEKYHTGTMTFTFPYKEKWWEATYLRGKLINNCRKTSRPVLPKSEEFIITDQSNILKQLKSY